MKALTKKDIAARDKIIDRLEECANDLENAVDEFNSRVEELFEEIVAKKRDAYNEAIDDAENWNDDILCRMEDYASERSDKWGDSPAGESFHAWKECYEDIQFEKVDLDPPREVLESPDVNLAETMRELPEERE